MSVPLPEYVEYGPRLTFPPPFMAKGGHFLGLVLKGDPDKIALLCDRALNTPAQGKCRYKPLSPYIVMLVGSWGELCSGTPGLVGSGNVPESNLTLWLPVWGTDAAGSSERLCLFAPYVFIDNQLSLLIGREDFGYAKAIANFEAPSGIAPPRDAVKVLAFGGDLAQGQAGWYLAVKLQPQGLAPGLPEAEWSPADVLAEKLEGVLPGPAINPIRVAETVKELLEGKAREVFLKQFRDASQAGRACFRQVVESPIEIIQHEARILMQKWDVALTSRQTSPIFDDLGIADQASVAAFELKFEMVLWPGMIIA